MAVVVKTENPRGLLSDIRRAIDEDKVRTWSYDADGDFTHTTDQWAHRAWLRPRVREGRLIFNVVPPRTRDISRAVYGVYHGRFIEMLPDHFDMQFTDVSATALATSGDKVSDDAAGVERQRVS